MSDFSLPKAVYILQSSIESMENKLIALRFLQQYVNGTSSDNSDGKASLDLYHQQKINQLILDNVLKIILNEDHFTNLGRRQMIRTELFLILASLLKSNTLFGSIKTEFETNSEASIKNILRVRDIDDVSSLSEQSIGKVSDKSFISNSMTRGLSIQNDGKKHYALKLMSKTLTNSLDITSIEDIDSSRLNEFSNSKITKLNLLEPIINQTNMNPRSLRIANRSKIMKPRPSVLFNDKLETDGFVPGADPLNFIEQDRKLGYQKPRMWVPSAKIDTTLSLLPQSRNKQSEKPIADRIVDEFLQMRALVSYVGDLVLPYNPNNVTPAISKRDKSSRDQMNDSYKLRDFTVANRFDNALDEAVQIWTPLVGIHIPKWSKNESLKDLKENQFQELKPFKYLKKKLEEFEKNEKPATSITNYLDRSNFINEDDLNKVKELPRDIQLIIDERKRNIHNSIKSMDSMIASTIKSQYALLPPKFLLLIEGDKANQRKLVANTCQIFCRVKRRNMLELALGIWKISFVTKVSVENRKKYGAVAATHLTFSWLVTFRIKRMQLWLYKWRKSVTFLIFCERYSVIVKLQSLYRRWRDRRKLIQMHNIRHYDGILSDIYLAPKRKGLIFFIPDTIRNTRRLYYLAARKVQSRFRSWSEGKEYIWKRRKVVLLQSICRMWPIRVWFLKLKTYTIKCQSWARRTIQLNKYKLWKKAAIIIQKYTRRYLGILWKLRELDIIWHVLDIRITSAIMIQLRWREHIARKKINAKILKVKMREYAALVIQRNYFRMKRAFHTFFLMCAYRIREEEDLKMEQLATRMGRYKLARLIQRFYKLRYFKRNISAIVKVQCWYRGRQGYTTVTVMRRIKWATRKLFHWARIKLRNRNALIRKIQKWWWNLKPGRLLRHLWQRIYFKEIKEKKLINEKKYHAAGRIQALIKGIWDRRWVIRHRAVLKIQKNAKFFFGLKRMKRMKKEQMLAGLKKYVKNVFDKAIASRTKVLLYIHSRKMIKPQAIARGFIVRNIFSQVRQEAYKVGVAAIVIQRRWRTVCAMSLAKEEIMGLRRMYLNPFKNCNSIQELLEQMRKSTAEYYSSYDPRVGMRVSTLLCRMGCREYIEMFPVGEFQFVADMRVLNMVKMTKLYETWMKKVERSNKKKDSDKEKKTTKQSKPVPVKSFQSILDVVTPPLYTRKKTFLDEVNKIKVLPEYTYPDNILKTLRSQFIKKFGKTYQTRALNFGKEVVSLAWLNYNNFKSMGDALTITQVTKALSSSPDSGSVISVLEEVRSKNKVPVEDLQWDKERLSKCAEILQLAVDCALKLLPEVGVLCKMVEKVVARVALYRRKNAFVQKKMSKKGAKSRKVSNPVIDVTESVEIESSDTATVSGKVMNVAQSIELPFTGGRDDFELEININVCKIYFELLDSLMIASSGIQSLKNGWSNKSIRRAIAQEKLNLFLQNKTKEYILHHQTHHVQNTWNKIRKKEAIIKKVSIIIDNIRKKIIDIQSHLWTIPRFGWQQFEDGNGYQYWFDMSSKSEESTYEMPMYSMSQWKKVSQIQRVARIYIEKMLLIKKEKEELNLLEIERLKEKMRIEAARGLRISSCTLSLFSKTPHKRPLTKSTSPLIPSIESLIPWKYRFETDPELKSGMWALMKSLNDQYEIVVIFKLRKEKKGSVCNARTVKGKKYMNVNMSDIFQINLDKGTKVEVRHKGRKLFYRGEITKIVDVDRYPVYSVEYEDGEIEENIARQFIRPTQKQLNEFLYHREEKLKQLQGQYNRMIHFNALRNERISSGHEVSEKPTVKNIIKTKVWYSQTSLRFGWSKQRDDTSYYNSFTGEFSDLIPNYTAKEILMAGKIQTAWLSHKAHKIVIKKIYSTSILEMIKSCITKAARFAYVGYGFEGLTTMQILRRAGHWELAETIELFYKTNHKDILSLSIDDIIQVNKDYETMGIQNTHVRALRDFQNWWKKLSTAERDKKLTLFNYYNDPNDSRSIQDCIKDSEDLIFSKFTKVITTGPSRTKASVKVIVEESMFPHTHPQIEYYLKKYADKPELARDSVHELVNKKTTHSWIEEQKALKLMRRVTYILTLILRKLHFKELYKFLFNIGLNADKIVKPIKTITTRQESSGPEAKAALLLRRDVLEFMTRYLKAVFIIQKNVKSYLLSKNWIVALSTRKHSTAIIQRASRRCLAYKVSKQLRLQQSSEWEQLWNPNRNILYYFNYITKKSQYDEPGVPFRPLVRDRLSSSLIQAWPYIDHRRGEHALLPGFARQINAASLCATCQTRRCVRVCMDCYNEDYYDASSQLHAHPYCFSCYTKEHTEHSDKFNHNFHILGEKEEITLKCCLCNAPASRKCLGILDDNQIDEICSELKRSRSDQWMKILKNANVGGEKKLTVMLENITNTEPNNSLNSNQLQSVRTLLEQTRAECDECYCSYDYQQVHSGGKRSLHRWIGFQVLAKVCTVCANSPAAVRCYECECIYCKSCFQVFHGMGRKRKHKNELILEDIEEGQEYCKVCTRRAGTVSCQNGNCEVKTCDSCYEFSHLNQCDKDDSKRKNVTTVVDSNVPICVVCNDIADQKCLQCNDFYCSKTWMGNPGCFIQYHSKGNRATHVTQLISKDRSLNRTSQKKSMKAITKYL